METVDYGELNNQLQRLMDLAYMVAKDKKTKVVLGRTWYYDDKKNLISVAPLQNVKDYEMAKAVLCHEIGHKKFTNQAAWMRALGNGGKWYKNRLFHACLNSVEDVFVENKMGELYGGFDAFMTEASNFLVAKYKELPADKQPHPFAQRTIAILAIARGYDCPFEVPTQYHEFAAAAAALRKSGGDSTVALAEEIYEAIKKEFKEEMKKAKAGKDGWMPESEIERDEDHEEDDEPAESEPAEGEQEEGEDGGGAAEGEGEDGEEDGEEDGKDENADGEEKEDAEEGDPTEGEGEETDSKAEGEEGEGDDDDSEEEADPAEADADAGDGEGDEEKPESEEGEDEDENAEGGTGDKGDEEESAEPAEEEGEDGEGKDTETDPDAEDDGDGEGDDEGDGEDGEADADKDETTGEPKDGEAEKGKNPDAEADAEAEAEGAFESENRNFKEEDPMKDAAKELAKRLDVVALGNLQVVRPPIWLDVKDLEDDALCLGKDFAKRASRYCYRPVGEGLGEAERAMYVKLQNILIEASQTERLRGMPQGRIHGGSLHRIRHGEFNVFTKKTRGMDASQIAVAIVVDCSGSMSGEKELAAREAAYLMGETLQKCGVSFGVYGFTSLKVGPTDDYPCVLEIKTFRDMWQGVKENLKYLGAYRNNYDAASLLDIYKKLLAVNAKRRIMIVISDGQPQPEDPDFLQSLIPNLMRGVDVVGVGLAYTNIEKFYPQNVKCGVKDLATNLAPVLQRLMLDKRRKLGGRDVGLFVTPEGDAGKTAITE